MNKKEKLSFSNNRLFSWLLFFLLCATTHDYGMNFSKFGQFARSFGKAKTKFQRSARRQSKRSYQRFSSPFKRQTSFFANLFKNFYKQHKSKIKITALSTGATGTFFGLKALYSQYEMAQADSDSEIETSLSYKAAKTLGWNSIKKLLQHITNGNIKDERLSMQEITHALKREIDAVKDKNLAVYHVMPIHIVLALSIYTQLHDQITHEKTLDDFMYIRTFESVKDTKGAKNGLSFLADDIGERHVPGMIFSGNTFLFAGEIPGRLRGESVFTRKAPNTSMVIYNIVKDICLLYKVDNEQCRNEIKNLILNSSRKIVNLEQTKDPADQYKIAELQKKGVILQFIFPSEPYTLQEAKRDLKKLPPQNKIEEFYVGYDQDHLFPDLYWAMPGALFCNTPGVWDQHRYNGTKMFQETVNSDNAHPDASKSQVALVVTDKLLKEKKYRVYPIDINDQYKSLLSSSKNLQDEIQAIIKKYK